MKNMKKYVALFVCALALVAIAGVGITNAYFTARTEAIGAIKVTANDIRVIPEEKNIDGQKAIYIKNDGLADCFARVKVIYPSTLIDCIEVVVENPSDWIEGDGFYYYKGYLKPGEKTPTKITVSYKDEKTDVLPDEFNVVVVTECLPVLDYDDYEAHGVPTTSTDWAKEFVEVKEDDL